jgi:hypothetical protein
LSFLQKNALAGEAKAREANLPLLWSKPLGADDAELVEFL